MPTSLNCDKASFCQGVVSLEFIFLLPLIVGIFYGSAVYGLLFYNKLEMQRAVDRAAASAFSLDRRQYSEFGDAVVEHTRKTLQSLVRNLPESVRSHLSEQTCESVSEGGVVLLECRLKAENAQAFLPQLNLGFLGRFPPQPQVLTAQAAVAF